MTTPWGSGGAVGRATLADERGWALVETMVSAVLLIVIALAINSSLDTASRASAENKQRSIAATLAEQDQERMRAMDPTVLSNYHPAAQTVTTPDGGKYTVTSRSDWIRDASGNAESCTSNTTQADYLRITSTVTSGSVGTDTKPVVSRGIVTPAVGTFGPGLGTFAVQVVDRNNNPVPNILVTTSGTGVYSDYTNSLGCVVFGYIPVGGYTATASNPGANPAWVDQDSSPTLTASTSGTVAQGQVNLVQVTYDQSGSITANFDGVPPAPNALKLQVVKSTTRTVSVAPAGATSMVVPNNFPALSPATYAVYAGSCSDANPGSAVASALVTPAGNTPVSVHLPVMTIKVQRNGVAAANAHVKIKSTVSGCSGDNFDGYTDPSGNLAISIPYGHFSVCADHSGRKLNATGTQTNTGTGITVPTINILDTSASAPCT